MEPLPPDMDLSRYVRERVYQISGQSIQADLLCEDSMLSDVLDRFGLETGIRSNGDGNFVAMVTAEPVGLQFWALQYMDRCKILGPDWLRREICTLLRDGWSKYQNGI